MFNKITPKLRVIYWFLTALFKKYFRVISISFLISIFVLLLIRTVYPFISVVIIPRKEKIAIIGEYTPSTLPLTVQSLLSSGLTSITLEGSPSASLCTHWEVTSDGKTYTFFLKKGIKWNDDKEFKADDVNYNLKNAIIIPKNDYELEVHLNEPYTPLPVLLAKPLFKKGLIGLGPYKVKSLKLNGNILEFLEIVPTIPDLPNKIFRFYQTEEKAIIAFKLGEIDRIEEINDPKELKDWNNVNITEKVLLNRYVGLFINTKNEYFKDKEIRQIINIATPAFFGEKPLGPISPLSWAYYPKVKQYEQNLDLAKKRVMDTPVSTSSAVIKLSTFQNLLSVANKIIAEWKKVNINAEVKIENAIPTDFDVLLATQEIPPDPDQYPLWHSVQTTTNITKLSNPKIDKLLEDGRIINNLDERLKIYADFQRFLAEESPVVFLYYPRVYTVERK